MLQREGYSIIILLVAISVLSIGLLVAIPVWQTQIQREKEEELIFRGKQYVEAIRRYQLIHPGRFPKNIEELIKEKCLRKLFTDPMTELGEWNIILLYQGPSTKRRQPTNKVLVVPLESLPSIPNPNVIGVVSSSTEKSIRIHQEQETYDKWLFFYGHDPKKMPDIVYYGQTEKN